MLGSIFEAICSCEVSFFFFGVKTVVRKVEYTEQDLCRRRSDDSHFLKLSLSNYII